MSLATKHRPATLEDVAGNEQTIKSLQAILARKKGDIQHAFLFAGPSGCGKTTLARIVAAELQCTGRDYTEVDTGQFRGIDTIREIRSNMIYKPLESTCRIWLLDECHMLGAGGASEKNAAQNALLKALEDCPSHVYFILATTNPEMLLPTIRGRCAEFEVAPLDTSEMAEFLQTICRIEKRRVPQDVIKLISRDSLGSCRNALQILDKVIDLDPDEMKSVAERTAEKENQVIDLCRSLMKREKWPAISNIIKGLQKEDPEKTRLAIMGYAKTVALNEKDASAAYLILDTFKEPTYSNGWAQLVWAAYTCIAE